MTFHGCATPQGTERYRNRFAGEIPPEHFRLAQGLRTSSIGLGTYLGNHDAEADRLYRDAVIRAVELGCNVIDSAINYRFQRSERSIGGALAELQSKGIEREEIILATKGGFIPFDDAPPKDVRAYFEANFVQTGIASFADVVAGCHCMTPRYLLNQLDSSLKNLRLDCIDIYYVHNPETQLGKIERSEFNTRLLLAFEALEDAVSAGKIRCYGTATWNAYRNAPDAKDYLSLAEVVGLAEKAGGREHHFKAIQLPLNLGMTEALSNSNQRVKDKTMTILDAAQILGITVMCSASVLQGQLTRNLPHIISDTFPDLATDAQKALQFVRSTPGVTTALVGMKQIRHVEENLATARIRPAAWERYSKLFQVSENN